MGASFLQFIGKGALPTPPLAPTTAPTNILPPSKSPFNPNTPNSQFVNPNAPQPGTTTASKFMGSLIPAAGQVGMDIATAIPKAVQFAGTRIAQGAVQTANEFQNPGSDTPVDTGNPQRANAGGTATPLPPTLPPASVNTSNSEANINKPQTVLPQNIGGTVEPQQQGTEGLKQIGGQALGAANAVGEGAMIENPIQTVQGIKTAFQNVIGDTASKLGINLSTQDITDLADNISSKVSDIKSSLPSMEDVKAKLNEPVFGTQVTPKISPEMQNAQGDITQTQGELNQAQTEAQTAQQARSSVVQPAVTGAGDIQTGLKGAKAEMGANFGNAATQVEQVDPNLRLNLTNEQLNALNDLKQGKNFALPDNLDIEKNPTAMVGGKALDLSQMNPKIAAQIQSQLGTMGNETATSLTPTQAQDLITRLNGSTYKEVGGTLQVDQQRVALTNEIKDAAQSAFGHITDANGNSIWNEAYQNYSQGSKAMQSFENLLNIKAKTTPDEVISNILKLDSPEQKLVLQNMVDTLQNSPANLDLTDPIKTIQDIADKQTALDEANSALSDAQKAANKAQRAKDILTMKEQIKNSTWKGRNPGLAQMGSFMARRAIWGVTGGLIMSVFVYAAARKLLNGTTVPKPPSR